MVSTSDCGPGGRGSNPSRVTAGFSSLIDPYPGWVRYGPNGEAGTTQPSFIHDTDATLRVPRKFLKYRGFLWSTPQVPQFPDKVDAKIRGMWPCHAVSIHMDLP